jgi:hypothetical protein
MLLADPERYCQVSEMSLRLLGEHHEQHVARPKVAVARIELAEQRIPNEHALHALLFNDAAVIAEPPCARLRIPDRQQVEGIGHLHR